MANDRTKWITLLCAGSGVIMTLIDILALTVAIPSIQSALKVSVSELSWVLIAYQLCYAAVMVLGGRLGDLHGHKRVFVAGLILFTSASASCGLSLDVIMLIASRSIQGIGAALLVPSAVAMVSNAFPAEERHKATGILFGISGVGQALGPLLGGTLTQFLGWRSIFFVNVPIAIVSLLGTLAFVPSLGASGKRQSLDIAGALTLSLGTFAIVLAMNEGDQIGWFSPWLYALVATAIVLLIAFILIEGKASAPIIELSLVLNRDIAGTVMVGFLRNFVATALIFYGTLYLQNILGYSPTGTGLMFLPFTLMVVITGPLAGQLASRLGPKRPLLIGLVFVMISQFIMATASEESGFLLLMGAMLLAGTGHGLGTSLEAQTALTSVEESETGVTVGLISMMREIGGVMGIAATQILFSYVRISHSYGNPPVGPTPDLQDNFFILGFMLTMDWVAGVAVASFIFAVFLLTPGRATPRAALVEPI
ncbi:Multidrug resistance protein stp [Planctomycetes bacterium Pan216]|uniref:Multidrug resistance protein stp n=1 Tax=Kolteria novifilia TaxID=2527975 RepID=A0A518B4R1_9BACT|nr:Multidrug resistance protein stp [Planctomycetes bacterium Pan216]